MRNVFDIHHDCEVVLALSLQNITTNTTTVGETIDTVGYEALEFLLSIGTVTDGTFTVAIYEGDESDMSDEAVISSEKMLGAPVLDTSDTLARVGALIKKRYARLKIVSTVVTSGATNFFGMGLLANAHHKPVADQNG